MNSHDDDRDLRESFALQRREEERQATALRRLLDAARVGQAQRPRAALTPASVVATILVVLVLATGQILQLAAPVTAPSLADWNAPTAFLLQTPGREFLSTVPAFARAVPTLEPDAPPAHVPPHSPTK